MCQMASAELAGDVDPGDLRAALPAQALLGALGPDGLVPTTSRGGYTTGKKGGTRLAKPPQRNGKQVATPA